MAPGKESSNLVVVGNASRTQLVALNQFHIVSVFLVVFLNLGISIYLLGEGSVLGPSILTALSIVFLWFFAGSILQCLATIKLLMDFSNPNYLALELYMRRMTKWLEVLPIKKEPYLMFLHYYTSFTQQYQGKHKEAIEQIEKTNLKHMAQKGLRYPFLATELSNLAISLNYLDKPEEALEKVAESISICHEQEEDNRHALVYPLTAKAAILIKQNKLDQALAATKESLKLINSIKKPPLWMVPLSIEQYKLSNVAQLAVIALLSSDMEKIELYIMQIESIYNQTKEVIAPQHFKEFTLLAKCLKEKDRSDLAYRILQMIYNKAAQIPVHPDIPAILDQYEEVLTLEGRKEEIANMRAWLLLGKN